MGKYCAESQGVVATEKDFYRPQVISPPKTPPSPRFQRRGGGAAEQRGSGAGTVTLGSTRPARRPAGGALLSGVQGGQHKTSAEALGHRGRRGRRSRGQSSRHPGGLERGERHGQQMRCGRGRGRHLRSVAAERLSSSSSTGRPGRRRLPGAPRFSVHRLGSSVSRALCTEPASRGKIWCAPDRSMGLEVWG